MARIEDERPADVTDETAALTDTGAVQAVVPPELVATSLTGYIHAWIARLRAGETGMLPVIVGLVVISVIFQSLNSKFLSAGNLVNLLVQGAVYMLLAM